jgi:hypothetical protein
MYYFLAGRKLVNEETKDGRLIPFMISDEWSAKQWVLNHSEEFPEKNFQYFESSTEIKAYKD